MAGEYTPTADFEFSAAAYTPSPDFEFVTATLAELVFGQHWALTAPGIAEQPFGQQWSLQGVAIADRPADLTWSLATFSHADRPVDLGWGLDVFTYLGRPAGLRWALATPVFGNRHHDARWSLAAAVFGSRMADQRWSIQVPAFASRAADLGWALTVHDYAGRPIDLGWGIDTVEDFGDLVLRQRWVLQATAIWTRVVSAVTYTLTLTGGPDGTTDIELPMASYSSRLRSGESSYLQVSVPNARAHAADIAARPNGELVIRRGLRWSDGSVEVEEIARATLSLINLDIGARSSAVSLQARGTVTNSTPKTVTLRGASYRALTSGRRRFRCGIDNTLRPGDTALIDGESIVVDQLSHVVSPRQGWMEIAEAG